jgi:serine/threonine-protein kinase
LKGNSLLHEIRRRRVLPVVGGYLVAAWVLIQVSDVVVPALALPDYWITVVLILSIIGFPVVIVLAWIFDITTDGIKRTLEEWHDIEPSSSAEVSPKPESSNAPPGSLVVLPFLNIGGNQENEYFSDGLTEDIIDALAKVPSLKVVARTSSFVFKNKDEDTRIIGARLNVKYLVEGSIRKSGDRIRIVCQLIKVEDGYHIWSETFDRELLDIFDTLDEIKQAIAQSLIALISDNSSSSLGAETEQSLAVRHTSNLDAYHLYLKGRYFWNQRGQGIMQGMEFFQEAAAADSRYALPYVGLADSYGLLGYYGFILPTVAFPLAQENANKALNLNSSLGEAHTSLALVKMYFDWDFEGARKEFLKAIELNNQYAPAYYWRSVLHTILQEPEQALNQDSMALKVDPVSPFVNMHHGWTLHCAGRDEDAIAQYLKTLKLDSKLWPLYQLLTYAYAEVGKLDEALDAGEKIKAGTNNSILPVPSIGYAYAKCGEKEKALAVIDELISREGEFFWPSHVASIYAVLGEFDAAFEWLEKAYEIRDHWLITMNVQPGFKILHGHPKYSELATRVGIGEPNST